MKKIKIIIDSLGAAEVTKLCGILVRTVYKWCSSNFLSRTEYTGETKYSEILS